MRMSRRGDSGFTLVEVVIVLGILGVLAAVVLLNVAGIFRHGGEQGYATDRKTIQAESILFYYDGHANDTSNAWNSSAPNPLSGHWYPTSTGLLPDKTIEEILVTADADPAYSFLTEAIWMGLLFNPPGPSTHDKDNARPLVGEKGPYLNQVPKSASKSNHSLAAGSYTWVITRDGVVYGVYWDGAAWRAGYGGVYP